MASTNLVFSSRDQHRAWLASQAELPRGFRVGTAKLTFSPFELPSKIANMNLTLIALDEPTPDFAAVFTNNAFPGAPVKIGRRRLEEPRLSAILINNKISNVCAPGGEETSERLCEQLAELLQVPASSILPCSTGVIGWRLPLEAMLGGLPEAVRSLSNHSGLVAAEGIVTTDLYPKLRSATFSGGRIVGVAKILSKQFFMKFDKSRHLQFSAHPATQAAELRTRDAGIELGKGKNLFGRKAFSDKFGAQDVDVKLDVMAYQQACPA